MPSSRIAFIAFVLMSLGAKASDKAYLKVFDERAPFCHFYENLGDEDEVSDLKNEAAKKGGVSVYKYSESDLDIKYNDVVRWRYDALDFRVANSAVAFRKKLVLWTSHLSLRARSKYYAAFDLRLDPELENQYNSCLNDRVSPNIAEMNRKLTSTPPDEAFYKDVIIKHFTGAISLAAIKEKLDILKSEFKKQKNKLNKKYSKLRLGRVLSNPSQLGQEKPSKELQEVNRELEELGQLEIQTLTALKVPLYQLAKDFPLLFSFKLDPKLLNWMHKEIVPSSFYYELIKGVDPELWKVLKARIAVMGDFNSLLEIYQAPELEEEWIRFFDEKYENPVLKEKATQAAQVYVTELTEHSLSICQQGSKNKLHYSQALVESVFNQNLRSHQHKNLTVRDHAGYCQLLREDPPIQNSGFSRLEKIGFSAFAAGMTSQFLTSKWKWANALYIGGSGAFIWNGVQDWNINSLLRSSTVTMIPNGFSDIGEYKKLLNEQGDILTAGFTEILFSGAVVGALRHIDRLYMRSLVKNYHVKRYEFEYPLRFVAAINRGKVKQGLLANGSEEARKMYLAITAQKNKLLANMEDKYGLAIRLKGMRDQLGRLTLNHDWSAYFGYRRKKSDIDLVMVVIRKNAHKTAEGRKQLQALKEGLEKFRSTSEVAREAIDRAFDAKKTLPILKAMLSQTKNRYFWDRRKTFTIGEFTGVDNLAKMENGKLRISIDRVIDGRKIKINKEFASSTEFRKYVSEIRSYSLDGVSSSVANESVSFFWSKLMDDMFELSMDHRIYEITRKRLESIKINHKLSSHQEEILVLLNSALKNTPRIDTTLKTLFAELRWEIYDGLFNIVGIGRKFLLRKSRELQRFDESYEQITSSNPFLTHIKNASYLGFAGFGSSAVIHLFNEGSKWHQRKELAFVYFRDLQRRLWGATMAEKACAKTVKPLQFTLCFHNLAFAELGYEWSKGISSGEPYERILSVKRKSRAFADRMVRMRINLRVPELYGMNNTQINRAINKAMIQSIIERIELNLPEGQEVDRELVGGLVFGLFQTQSTEEFIKIIAKIRTIYPENIVLALSKAWKTRDNLKKMMSDQYVLPMDIVNLIDDYKVRLPGANSERDANTVLDLFQADLISSMEQVTHEKKVESEVSMILGQGVVGQPEDRADNLLFEILNEADKETEEEVDPKDEDTNN